MKIQSRVIFIITIITLIIVIFSISAAIILQRGDIKNAQEQDIKLVAQIADYYVSGEIKALKFRAKNLAFRLAAFDEHAWPDIVNGLLPEYDEFIGLSIIDRAENLLASSGKKAAPPSVIENHHVCWAFNGEVGLSTTHETPDGVVFYMGAPLPGIEGKIVVLTIPGQYFAEKLASINIWESGHIFIDDSEGYIVANRRSQWVEDRVNFVLRARTDPDYEGVAETVKRGIRGESGVGYFTISEIPRLCAFRPISGSDEGWFLGVIAPLPESPFVNIERAMYQVAIIGIILSVFAAVIASFFIKKPFEQIAALKEAAEGFSRTKSEFLAKMSHEIRTPMNVVLGVTDSNLQKKELPDEYREDFEKIYSASDLLLHIINDILDLSKIEAGKMEIKVNKYEMASLISDVVHQSKVMYADKPIKFKLQVTENIPMLLYGDEFRIRQILNNILSNAFKYTQEGKVELAFSCEELDQEEINLIFRVTDTGQGLSPEQLELLFDEYIRFNSDKNHSIAGTGLGMPITYKLIKMMGGDIKVDSKEGEGSSFTVSFPQRKGDDTLFDQELVKKLESFQISEIKHEKKGKLVREPMPYGKVLVVDDIVSNIDVAKLLLKPYELKIEEAESGFEAIAKVEAGTEYDIIFMDHMMPKMDGIEATLKIRKKGYANPIIALTANAVAGQEEIFHENGFDDFISKPIDIRQLNEILKKYVRDRHLS